MADAKSDRVTVMLTIAEDVPRLIPMELMRELDRGQRPFDDTYDENVYPEYHLASEPEDMDSILDFVRKLTDELIEMTLPEPKRALTLEEAGKCLSLLGKIWNLSDCKEGCGTGTAKCDSEERLLDIEGYVEEYQYLHLGAVDMGLTDVRVIPHFVWLLSVDLTGNSLTNVSACPLRKLPNLVSLKLNRNRIVDPYLEPMKHLQYLGMNSNKIESLHRIYHPNLTTLDVSWNCISRIDGADCWKLNKLEQLELRGNRLTTTFGIEYENLVALYLADNQITQLRGLEHLPNLQRLHLRKNPLSDLTGFSTVNTRLEYLNLRSCQIGDVEELRNLQVLTGLTTLVVKDNLFNRSENEGDEEEAGTPAEAEEEDEEIRLHILMLLPQLKRINKKAVSREEAKAAKEALAELDMG